MIYRELLTKELIAKRGEFLSFTEQQSGEFAGYLKILETLEEFSSAEIRERVLRNESSAAIPSHEFDRAKNFILEFSERWENHEQARKWAFEKLNDRTTFAADASQLLPGRDISLPVAAIQVGWYENPHDPAIDYEINADFRILSPIDLLEDQEEQTNLESRVSELRFHAEADRTLKFLRKKRGWQKRGERMPLAFYDNTLLVSYPQRQSKLQKSFVEKMLEVVRVSQETQVPVVGYIDQSYARDVLHLIQVFDDEGSRGRLTTFDTSLLRAKISEKFELLKKWGDRSVFFYSNRKPLAGFWEEFAENPLVGFVYLQTTADGPPARLDIPSWIFETNHLEEVLDIVRAECVIGLGYPYAIETADATAVISIRDREIFLGALQEFANREKLNFSVSRKSTSKARRR